MERARHGETPTLLGPLGLEAEGPGVKPGRASAASRNGGGGGGEGPGGPVRCAPGEPLLGGGVWGKYRRVCSRGSNIAIPYPRSLI